MQANSQALRGLKRNNRMWSWMYIGETKIPSVARRRKNEKIFIRDTHILIQNNENYTMFELNQNKFPDFPWPLNRGKK